MNGGFASLCPSGLGRARLVDRRMVYLRAQCRKTQAALDHMTVIDGIG